MIPIRSLSELETAPHANVFPEHEPKTIRLELEAGEEVPSHTHPDREIVLYVVAGRLELCLGDDSYELNADEIARFDGDREISPRAIKDSTALIVLAKRANDEQGKSPIKE
jgi:quercetin dioxygenase-like cupin family protein